MLDWRSMMNAVLVFASLAIMLLYKGYDRLVEPHAAAARARRNEHSIDMLHHSTDKVHMHWLPSFSFACEHGVLVC
jgi:hypothetical protein